MQSDENSYLGTVGKTQLSKLLSSSLSTLTSLSISFTQLEAQNIKRFLRQSRFPNLYSFGYHIQLPDENDPQSLFKPHSAMKQFLLNNIHLKVIFPSMLSEQINNTFEPLHFYNLEFNLTAITILFPSGKTQTAPFIKDLEIDLFVLPMILRNHKDRQFTLRMLKNLTIHHYIFSKRQLQCIENLFFGYAKGGTEFQQHEFQLETLRFVVDLEEELPDIESDEEDANDLVESTHLNFHKHFAKTLKSLSFPIPMSPFDWTSIISLFSEPANSFPVLETIELFDINVRTAGDLKQELIQSIKVGLPRLQNINIYCDPCDGDFILRKYVIANDSIRVIY